MGDEDPAQVQIVPVGQPVGDIGLQAVGKAAAILFPHAHLAVPDLDAGLELQQIGPQHRRRRAPAALLEVLELFENKAGVHPAGHGPERLDDLPGRNPGLGQLRGPEHHQAVAGGEIAAVHHIDVVELLSGQHRVLIAGGKLCADVDVDHRVIVPGVPGEDGLIARGVDRRRHRQAAALGHVGIDVLGLNVHAVVVVPAVHGHRQRHQLDLIPLALFPAQIAGGVGCDFDIHYKFQSPFDWNRHTPFAC